jgi:hypothetical protein
MYLMIKRLLFWLTFTLVLFACNNKENNINITQSDLHPMSGQFTSFSQEFSFKDQIDVNGENYKLLIANTEEIQSQAVISFAYLPENVEYIANATLTLYSDLKPYGDMEFKIKRLEQDYLESEANWLQASQDVDWDENLIFTSQTPPITLTDTIAASLDSLVFNIPADEIKTWTQTDQTLFSLIIYTDSDNYIEVYSSENSKNPVLKFNYMLNSETEEKTYERNAFKDTYIVNDKQETDQTWSSILTIGNMPPKRAYFKFDVDTDMIASGSDQTLTDFQKEHITINSAYVRFYVKDFSFFEGNRNIYITPWRVKEEVSQASNIDSDMLEYLVNTGTSLATIKSNPDSTQYIDVKITPILQGFITGEKDNFGIVMTSSYQSSNFDQIELWGKDAEDADLRPKVHFIYTLPMEE